MRLQLQDPLAALVFECQTECVVECCGLDAILVDSEQMIPWACEQDVETLWGALDQLAGLVSEVTEQGEAVSSSNLNHRWESAAGCLAFLRLVQTHAIRAVEVAREVSLALEPEWLTSTVVALARGIYAEQAFDRLPILADALQDAGCDHTDILDHCRGPGPHARGCWVVDIILGKS